MMKRFLGIALALSMLTVSASAAVYTDAPGTPTQDRAISLTALWQDEQQSTYELDSLPADQLTMDTATEIYEFVYEQGNRPVRWYPEETQKEIEKMVSVDPDSLYMTEFMRLHAEEAEPEADLSATMTLKIDYQPGQVTLVVLGNVSNPEGIAWTPVDSTVIGTGVVQFEVPQELMESLQGNDLLFCLLTVRQGARGSTETKEETEEPESLPSKSAEDTTRIVETTDTYGEAVPNDFELEIVPETDIIRRELELLGQYVAQDGNKALSWLPEEDQNRVRYLLGSDADSLIVSDYVSLVSLDFLPTNGDAVATLSFATPYEEGQTIVTALGVPNEEASDDGATTLMKWAVQPATVREDGVVDIVFDQLALIDMDTETGLLLVLSDANAAQ